MCLDTCGLFIREYAYSHLKHWQKKAKFLVKMCLFICEFRNSKKRDVSTANNEVPCSWDFDRNGFWGLFFDQVKIFLKFFMVTKVDNYIILITRSLLYLRRYKIFRFITLKSSIGNWLKHWFFPILILSDGAEDHSAL